MLNCEMVFRVGRGVDPRGPMVPAFSANLSLTVVLFQSFDLLVDIE